ncbi:hypothetical protein [Microbacterium sp. A94]|uniref:hypothetical protein n=1 Tax=Microbacterium sp. A94 TaxID=3450717 RepID=UPI003F427A5D
MTRSHIITALAVAAGVTLILVFAIGVQLTFAVGWGILAGILTVCLRVGIPDEPRLDSPTITAGPERRGTAIARMAWSLNPTTGAAGALITRRVRDTLKRCLGRRDLDPDNPDDRAAIAALIDLDIWERLIGSGTTRHDIERALDAIDTLSRTKEKQ